MSVVVVVGAQWGDEGKGKIVDLLSNDFDIAAPLPGWCKCRPYGNYSR